MQTLVEKINSSSTNAILQPTLNLLCSLGVFGSSVLFLDVENETEVEALHPYFAGNKGSTYVSWVLLSDPFGLVASFRRGDLYGNSSSVHAK